MSQKGASENRQIARAASTVMAAFIFSNLVGLLRQILVAKAFGTQADMEAFNAANRVSETIFNLVAGGALASAFIPTFTSLLSRGERKRAWKLASSIANLILLITTGIGVLAVVLAPWIVRNLLAPGFTGDPLKEIMTIRLLRLMLPSTVIFGLSGLLMGILNSHQVFFFPALAPAMYQLGMIFGVLVLSPWLGILGLGWGVLIGAFLHLAFQIPSLFRLHGNYQFGINRDSPDVIEVAYLMGPRLLGVAVVQLNFWINTRLASQFSEGSLTAIVIAFSLMLMPQAAIAQSIAIAALPTFSTQISQGRMGEMRHSLASTLRSALVLSLPASVGLILMRQPIIQLLYQRGAFDERSTELVAWALLWYSAGLIGHALVEILSRAFYSLHDTKTPVLVGAGAMSLNVLFSYIFSAIFGRIGWMPHGGLALANTVATGLEAVGLILLMRRRLSGLETRDIFDGFWKSFAASTAMAIILIFSNKVFSHNTVLIQTTLGIGVGLVGYALFAYLIGLRESRLILQALRKRLAV